MSVTRTITFLGRGGRRWLAVTRGLSAWVVQWAEYRGIGTHYEKPVAGPFKTRREAQAAKRAILDPTGDAAKERGE